MTDTQTRFLALIVNRFGVIETTAQDPLDADFKRDCKPDSLDVIEVVMEIEEEFDIEITDDEMESFAEGTTLRAILALVEIKLAEKAVAA